MSCCETEALLVVERRVPLVCESNGPDGPLHTPCNNLQSDVS